LALANDQGKQVYLRSVFLQGLLLMRPEDLPAKLGLAKTMINNLETVCRKYNYTRQEMALLYIKAKYPQAKIVIGAETVPQLEQNLTILKDDFRSTSCIREIDDWPITDERIINPALWS
jgi:aryl-alcohol dehydrogenase-like predicted oxidoreductase